MSPQIPRSRVQSRRVFWSCLLAFNILISPIAAIASTYKKPEVVSQKSEPAEDSKTKSAVADVFAKPLEDLATTNSAGTDLARTTVPAAVPAPAPLPAAPPVGTVTSSLAGSLLTANGGNDADSDGKADPGDTIAYTLTLANTSGAAATGLAIANPLDPHTTIVGGSLNSTPVAFDQSFTTDEDINNGSGVTITLQGQDPDGSNLTFRDSGGAVFAASMPTLHGTMTSFGSVTCNADGLCSLSATYTPTADYNGTDSFSFKVNDGTSNSNEVGTVSITVNAVNDAPTFTVPGSPGAVNEDAGGTTVTNFISNIRPAQAGNATEDTQTVNFVITNVTHSALFTAGGQPTLNISGGGVPPYGASGLTANLGYTPAPNANGTSVVTYHLHDSGGTSPGVDISADQTFTITVNAVNDAPVAVSKAYTVQANMKLTGLSLPLTTGGGVTDADVTNANNDSNSADSKYFNGSAGPPVIPATPPAFSLTAGSLAPGPVATQCAATGTISNVVSAAGNVTFNYDPPPGFTGTCTLVYTITDNGNPGTATSAPATITLTINGPVVWFVKPGAGFNGNGTLSDTGSATGSAGPFNSLASASSAINLKTGQRVFVYSGTTPAGEALDLSGNNNWLVGQGTVTGSQSFAGVTTLAGSLSNSIASVTVTVTDATFIQPGDFIQVDSEQMYVGSKTGTTLTVTRAFGGTAVAGHSNGASVLLSSSQPFDTFTGVTPPAGTITRPALTGNTTVANGLRPTASGTVTMRNNTQVTGVNIAVTGASQGLKSTGFSAGTSLVKDVNVASASGNAVDFTGAQTITYETSDQTNSPNVINSTAGTGVSVVGTTFGANGFTFKSISAGSGTSNGITLNNTGTVGGFTVYGDGSNTALGGNSSGGTISGKSGGDGSSNQGTGIYLSSTKNVTLRRMTINGTNQNFGIFGSSVTNFTLEYSTVTGTNGTSTALDESSIKFNNLFGSAAITSCVIDGGCEDNLNVVNTSGTLDRLTVLSSTFGLNNATTGNNNITIDSENPGTVLNWTLNHSTVKGARADWVNIGNNSGSTGDTVIGGPNVLADGNTFDNLTAGFVNSGAAPGGNRIVFGGTGNSTIGIRSNNLKGSKGEAVRIRSTADVNGHVGVVNARVSSNVIGVQGTAGSGSSEGAGIFLFGDGGSDMTASVAGNSIFQYTNNGIRLTFGDEINPPSIFNVTVTGNTINTPSNSDPASDFNAIQLDNGSVLATDDFTTCVDVGGAGTLKNIVTGGGHGPDYPNNAQIRLRQRQNTTVKLPGYGGSNTDTAAVENYIFGRNTMSNPGDTNGGGGADGAPDSSAASVANASTPSNHGFQNIASCTQPSFAKLIIPGADKNSDVQIARLDKLFLQEISDSSFAFLNLEFDASPSLPAASRDALANVEAGIVGQSLALNEASAAVDGSAANAEASLVPARSDDSFSQFASAAISLIETPARAEAGVSSQRSEVEKAEVRDQRSEVGALTGVSNLESVVSTTGVRSQESGARRLNHARGNSKLKTENSKVAVAAAAPPTPVGSFPVNGTGAGAGFTLPNNRTITIKFKATLNTPPNLSGPSNPKVTAQAVLTGNIPGFVVPLQSDDPNVGGTADPTSTNVDLYDSTATLSANPPGGASNVGQPVTFTATIGTTGLPSGSAFNRTGTVNFKDGASSIGCDSQTVSHVGSNDVATCTTSSLNAAGSPHSITAVYSGDGNFDPSTSSAFAQTVTANGTSTAMLTSGSPSLVSQSVTFTAQVTSTGAVSPPTGTVQFQVDGVNSGGPVALTSGGACPAGKGCASFSTSSLNAAGSPHVIKGTYIPDAAFTASNNNVSQTVNKSGTQTGIASSQNPSFVGQGVTFTATVNSLTAVVPPTGSVNFHEGATNFGTVALSTGGGCPVNKACATSALISSLSAGPHTITADYLGDTTFNSSTINLSQQVNKSNTTMTVTSAPASPTYAGQSVTFTVKIVSSDTGTIPGPPTGTVKFWDGPAGGTQIGGDVVLTSGGACPALTACADSAAISTLTANTHAITVQYLGDGTFSANSGTMSEVVNKSDTEVNLVSSGATPNVGDPVTFTATIQTSTTTLPLSPVTFDNGGTVDFKDGATVICAARPINASHQATCVNPALPAGSRSITAVYNGDSAFNGSASNTVTQQVGPTCPSSIVVTDPGDSGLNTLRDAIANICDNGTITFAPAVTTISLATELHFTSKNMTITGPGSGLLTISGANTTRVFDVDLGRTITISGLTISGGRFLGGAGSPGFGGGVFNAGNLTLSNVTLSGNQAIGGAGAAGLAGGDGQGGAIFNSNSGTLALNNSLVGANNATGGKGGDSNTANGNGGNAFGGGIYNTGTLNLTNTTVSTNNSSGGAAGAGVGTAGVVGSGLGGGIYNDATASPDTVTISNSTINGNSASLNGGGMANVGSALSNATLSITNSTISGNSANNDGGGLYNDSFNGTTTITASTVTDNHADNDSSLAGTGGGIRVVSGTVVLQNTIVAANYQASLQVETATVTGGPITPGVAQVETLTVVVTSPPITTSGTGTLKVTIGGTTLADKSISLVNGDTAASIAVKVRDLLNADPTVHGPFTATVGTGGSTADVILTSNAPAANDGSLNLAIVGCGTSPCTGLNSVPTSANTTAGVAGSAGTQQVETATVAGTITQGQQQIETLTVTGGPAAQSGDILVKFTAATVNGGLPKSFTIPVVSGETNTQVATKIKNAFTAPNDLEIPNFFSVVDAGNTVVITRLVAAANDTSLLVQLIGCGSSCTGIASANSVDTQVGVAPTAAEKQAETVALTDGPSSCGAPPSVEVDVTAAGMNGGTTVALHVPVTDGVSADTTAADIVTYINNDTLDPNTLVVRSFFNVTNPGAPSPTLKFEAQTAANNDSTMHVTVKKGADTCNITQVDNTPSGTGNAGSPGFKQVETVTVSGGPVAIAGTIIVRVTKTNAPAINGGTPKDISVSLTALQTNAQVADAIKSALDLDSEVPLLFDVTTDVDKVVLTRKIEAADDPSLLVQIIGCGNSCTGISNSNSSDTQPGIAPGSGDATVTVTAAGMGNSPKTLAVAVVAGDDASAVAGKMRAALNGDLDITNAVTGFAVTGATDKIILTKNMAAGNDTSLNIATNNGTSTGLTPAPTSANTTAGVAPIAAVNQIETATVSIASSPISTNGTGIVRVTFNSTTLPDYSVPLLAGDNEAAVAIKIRDILNGSPAFNGTYTASVGTGGNTADVILTANSAATNDTSLNLEIIGCGSSCPGLNSVTTSVNTTTGVAPGTGTAKVTVTANPSYFFNPAGTKDIFVPVLASDTAVQVAAKISAFLNTNDTDVNSVFMASSVNDKVRLTRKVIAPDDPTLTIAIDNGTSTGLTPSPTSENTRLGGGSAIHDDINGAIDASSTYDLVGVSTGMTGISNGGTNQVGTGPLGIDPLLDPLDDYSGPTKTHRLQDGSPAIDKGSKFLLTTDQRGLQRPVDQPAPYTNSDDGSDIGAFEKQAATPVPTLTLTSVSTRDITPNFDAGNLVTGATVELLRGGVPTSPATIVTATGPTMPLTDNTLTGDGTYLYSVRQTVTGDTATSTPTYPALSVTVNTAPSIPDLFDSDDTFDVVSGGSSTDNITSITTPRFAGGAPTDPAVTIQLFANGNPAPIASGLSDGSGNWLITSSALAEGTYSITAREVIGSFTGSLSAPLANVVIDHSVTTPSDPVLNPADDTGTPPGDKITKINTPRLTGTGDAGSFVQLFSGATLIGGPTLVDNSNNWTVTTTALADNVYQVRAQATDVAGNVSALSGPLNNLVIDTTPPGPPSQPDLIAANDTGINNDNVTSNTTPTFTGSAEAGSNVQLFANSGGPDVLIGSATAGGGIWNITPGTPLTSNTYQITAKATDAAGNLSIASPGLSVTIDNQPPAAPLSLTLLAADDTGTLNNDRITKVTTPTINGTAEPNSTVDLFKDVAGVLTLLGTGSADVSGNWSIPSSALADGTYQIVAKATDLAGNQSVASSSLQITIDTQPPSAPPTPVLNPLDDTGQSNSDGITKKNNPNFTGTAEADSIVQLFAGPTPVGSVVATGGSWSITSGVLPDNSYAMTARATDVAGNTSLPSGAFTLVIDTVKPTVSMSSAIGNPTATTPIPVNVTFSEPVFNFSAAGIVPGPAAPPPPGTTINNFAGSGTTYSFDLIPGTAGGVFADIPAGGANDTAGNTNTAAVQFNRTFDPSALSVSITAISPNPRNTAVSSITIVFNKAVTGFDIADLTLKLNGGASLLPGGATLNTTDNATWTLDNLAGLTAAQGTYDLKLTAAGSNIQDSTSSPLTADATASWDMDTTAPTVTVEQAVGQADPVTGPTATTIINFTATFNEVVTGLTPSGVTLSGLANPTVVNVTGSGKIYNLAVQGMSQSGDVRASINLGAATDSAGNGNAASTSADNIVQFNADNFTTIEVNTTADTDDGRCDALGTGSGNQDCTLREAINAANADFGADTITFNSTVFAAPGPYTITLGSVLPDITTDMTITGPGAKVLTVKRDAAAGAFRIFRIQNGPTATISDLTVTNGSSSQGGGIYVELGTLTLARVALTGNTATGPIGGGGILVGGVLNVVESTISGNHATGLSASGGGIRNNGGTLSVVNSTISGNDATNLGGGGGVFANGTTTLSNSTIASNSANFGGGVLASTGGTVTLKSTLIGDNTATTSFPDVSVAGAGTFNSDGFNLIENLAGTTINMNPGAGPDITGVDPQLNPLADNGGPTMTHSLLCTSPVIDKGFKFTTTTDQRGGTRPFDFADAVYPNAAGGDGSDIGAYETQSAGGCVPTAVPPSIAPSTNEDTPVTMTLTGTYSQNINLTFAITQNPTIGQLGAISAPNCTFSLSMTCTATVTYTPNANANGADLFKFKVSAGGLDSDPADVTVTVNATNDPPIFLQAGNQTVVEDAGPQTVPNFITVFSPGPPDESGQAVQFIVTGNTNPGLFSAAPAIDGTGTLTYTSAANANGSATITIVAKDNGGGTDTSAPQSFTITVLSVNDAPSFTVGPNQTVLEDAGQQIVNNFMTGISVGPSQESAQTAQFIITNNTNPNMFVEGPVISPAGKLTYVSAPDANGTATITVVLKDNGGTSDGGQDTSAPQTFVINVTPVNDQPTLNPINNVTIDEDAATQTINLSGITAGGAETQILGITATSNNPSLIPSPLAVTYTSANANGSISFTPVADQNGFATITVTLKDDGGTANGGVDTVVRTFVIQVNPVNDAPVNHVPGPQTVIENSTLVFASGNNNPISISDVDASSSQVKVTLTATNGVLTLPNVGSTIFTVGDGTADPTMTFVGSVTNINAALQGLIFTPTNGFNGAASLQIITNDQGDTGSGGALTDTDTINITVDDGGALQFSAGTYSVSENGGPAVITITRTGGSAGTATVDLATSNGTATSGSDYTAVSQTVTFGIGEISKTVTVPITDDLLNEPDETVNLTLTNAGGSGALGSPLTAVLTITNDDPTGGYLKFSAPTYNVAEGGVATITVQRVGTLTEAVSVDFATTDNSNPPVLIPCIPIPGNTLASSRCDYDSAFGRLTWAAGDGSDRTFTVFANQDNYVEGPESLTLTLSNLTASAGFSGPSTATLTINDVAAAPGINPIDDSATFVEEMYRDFLDRSADTNGKAFWINVINHCNDPAQRPAGQTAAQCIQIARVVTAGAFFLSIEFQGTGGTAYLTNKAAFGGLPTFARFEGDSLEIGQNFVFGQPGADAILEANKVAYFNDYVARTEFVNTYGGVSNQQYVDTLISNTGVSFTPGERNQLVNGLSNQTETRATVLRKITEKDAFRTAEFNRMFVLMEYFGFLRRNPDQAGFDFWLNKLNTFNGDYFAAEMVKAFIESSEYRQRFGQ